MLWLLPQSTKAINMIFALCIVGDTWTCHSLWLPLKWNQLQIANRSDYITPIILERSFVGFILISLFRWAHRTIVLMMMSSQFVYFSFAECLHSGVGGWHTIRCDGHQWERNNHLHSYTKSWADVRVYRLSSHQRTLNHSSDSNKHVRLVPESREERATPSIWMTSPRTKRTN